MPIDGARVGVQGFGNVGSSAAELFIASGAKVTVVQDHTGTVHNPNGLDFAGLMAEVAANGGVGEFKGGDKIANEDFWDVETDFLIPAALESVITKERALRIKTKILLEGAERPDDARRRPRARRSRDQGRARRHRQRGRRDGVVFRVGSRTSARSSGTEDEINVRLDKIMVDAFQAHLGGGRPAPCPAAHRGVIVACTRVLQAREKRGLYP